MKIRWMISLFILASLSCRGKDLRPNVLLIYTDDLGYGDISAYNTDSKIPTPIMSKLADDGISFMDAHAPAAICAPSRYSLLTGRYAWREPGGTELGHAYSQCKISPDQPTVASLLSSVGYNTAQFGKWGLRHDYREALNDPLLPIDSITPESFDYTKPIYGANTRGFDYAFTMLMLAGKNGDIYAKNDKWFFENGFPYERKRPDPANFDWFACLPTLTNKVVEYIDTYAGIRNDKSFGINDDKPFFIYFDPHVPHLPVVPNKEFVGTSNAGEYGDFVAELDASIGLIIKRLEENGLMENTIVILSSDNGPENHAYKRINDFNHYSMGNLRGVKRDIWEGGHRVPLIIRWDGKVTPGSVSMEPVGLIDMMATLCNLTGTKIPEKVTEDSFDFSQVILGDNFASPVREPLIYHSQDRRFAIRDDYWVLIDASSGMVSKEPEWFRNQIGVETHKQNVELFNLKTDPLQLRNIAKENQLKVQELREKMVKILSRY